MKSVCHTSLTFQFIKQYKRSFFGTIFALSLLFVSSTVSYAQYDRSRITGTIVDASGAAVPNASISLKNDKTGETREAKTDGRGIYFFPNLPPTQYTIEAKSGGFASNRLESFTVSVGQERIVDLTLSPSSVSSTVEVSSGGLASVDTSSASMGVNVSEREVQNLPLNGRQLSQLYLLSPGAVNNGSGTFDDIRFSGRANQQNVTRVDGIEMSGIVDASPGNLNGESSSLFRLEQSLENIQEFKIDSNNYPAEYGLGTGGQISIVTKSGSNAFHGSLFEYVRNNFFDARNYFNAKGRTQSPLKLNQFGGSIGGPIKRDKLFFFLSQENLKQRITVPLTQGTFSARARALAVPSIRPLLAAFPLGDRPSGIDDLTDVVTRTYGSSIDEYSGTLRVDYRINEKNNFYVRYFRDQGYGFVPYDVTGSALATSIVPQNLVTNWSSTLSPTIVNEFKFGLNAYKTRYDGVAPVVPGIDLGAVAINVTGGTALGGIAGQGQANTFATPAGLNRANSASNGRGQPYTNFSLSFIDNLSVIKGSHNMKFGVEVRPISLKTDRLGGTTYTYANLNTFLLNQPSQVQFLGDVSAPSAFNGGAVGRREGKQVYYSGYAQDEWKIKSNITLNYGLRYDYFSILHEGRDLNVNFNPVTGIILPANADFYNSSKLNFGPRVALSWSPEASKNKTVLRIGGGYYYGAGQTEDQIQPIESDRASRTITTGAPAFPADLNAIFAGFAAGISPDRQVIDPSLQFQPRAYAPGYQLPEKILQYTASVQQQIAGGVLTAAYVGSQGRNLFLRSIANPIIGVTTSSSTGLGSSVRQFGNRYAEVDYKTTGGTDHYDALQVTYNRRFTKGLTIGSTYTWAHSIGNTAGSNEARTAANPFNFEADRGDNNFDLRHSLNFSTLYELPVGKGRRFELDNKFADLALGGWQMGGIVNYRSGLPMEINIQRPDIVYQDQRNGRYYQSPVLVGNVPVTRAVVNTPGGGNSRNIRRPDLVPGVNPYQTTGNGLIINPAAFALPAPGTYGNLARNALKGPDLKQLDLTLSKKFQFTEVFNLEFRAEAYNIFNTPNFANPGNLRLATGLQTGPTASGLQPGQAFTGSTAGGTFGLQNATVGQYIGQGTNRQIQLALRIGF